MLTDPPFFSKVRLINVCKNVPEKDLKNALCDLVNALRDLVLFVQFKKREMQPWRSVNFSKVLSLILQLY